MKKGMVINGTSFSNILLFMSLGLFLIITILDSSFYCTYFSTGIVKVCMYFSIALIIFKEILIKKIKLKELFYLLICLLLSMLLAYHLNRITILPLFFLLYGARNIPLDKILKFIVIITSTLLFIIILSSKIGIIPNYIYIIRSIGRTREYLGFRYSLFAPMYMFNISAIILYLNRKKFNIVKLIILVLCNYTIFRYTNSRLSYYLFLILILGYTLLCNNKIKTFALKRKLFRYLVVLSYVIVAIISFILTISFSPSNNTLSELNSTLENRLFFGKEAINNYGISKFGNSVKFNGNGLGRDGLKNTREYNYVDCLYINVAIKYGLIFLILFLLIHTVALHNINKNNDIMLLFILCVLAFHGMIDDLGLELYYNAFWFAIGNNILTNKNNQKA